MKRSRITREKDWPGPLEKCVTTRKETNKNMGLVSSRTTLFLISFLFLAESEIASRKGDDEKKTCGITG